MCAHCLKDQVDITEGIPRELTMFWCRGCGRYLRPPWVAVALESRELLSLCLKKIKGIGKEVKLMDAGFVWTEPHSMRIKVKLTVQKEVFNSAIMQQTFVVTFVVQNQQCSDCAKSYTEHTWDTVVQVRQKVPHKRTFFFLEQLMIKHNVAAKAIGVKEMPDGLDFYWSSRGDANAMIQFLQSVVPTRLKQSKRLISSDASNNTHRFKYTIFIELAPICKDDLVVLDARQASALGGVSQVLLCTKISNVVFLIDPVTLQRVELSNVVYWRKPIQPVLHSRQLVEFMVLDVERASPNSVNPHMVDLASQVKHVGRHVKKGGKPFALAEVQCMRSSDVGVNDTMFEVITHLGNVLKPGDTVLGYDLSTTNLTDVTTEKLRNADSLPEIILVRKSYPNRKNRQRNRKFKLKSLPKTRDQEPRKAELRREEEQYEQFLRELEEDPELRAQVNLYKRDHNVSTSAAAAALAAERVANASSSSSSTSAAASSSSTAMASATTTNNSNDDDDDDDDLGLDDSDEDDEFPEIQVEELLDDLTLDTNNSNSKSSNGSSMVM
eukprot:TRINITY_DN66326_c8_g9_i1.p1 TRINITY_DN66326_c8_g9~~TRINITY_DN66326_c8_g9_i1.p1  ORF type:complete len:603 (-),score=332.96 TRINITY_DN66326_c8_g9_i1:27-1682(-)